MSIYTWACNQRWELGETVPTRIPFFFQGQPHVLIACTKWGWCDESREHKPCYTGYAKRHRVTRQAYRRLPHHEKKDLSVEEQNRRLWWKRVRRGNNWHGHHGPGRWVKKQTTSYNRAHAKYCLQHDRDEDIHPRYGKFKFGYWD